VREKKYKKEYVRFGKKVAKVISIHLSLCIYIFHEYCKTTTIPQRLPIIPVIRYLDFLLDVQETGEHHCFLLPGTQQIMACSASV
jgi:hypothetical protein